MSKRWWRRPKRFATGEIMSIVLGYWLFVSTSAVVLISTSLYFGYCKKRGIIFWRTAKLFSAIFGVIGLIYLLFNFDKSVRSDFYSGAIQMAKDALWETKFEVSEYLHDHCPAGVKPAEAESTCSAFENIDRQINHYHLEQFGKLDPIGNWQHNPILEGPITEINQEIAYIKSTYASK
jgi:hypothetical protein